MLHPPAYLGPIPFNNKRTYLITQIINLIKIQSRCWRWFWWCWWFSHCVLFLVVTLLRLLWAFLVACFWCVQWSVCGWPYAIYGRGGADSGLWTLDGRDWSMQWWCDCADGAFEFWVYGRASQPRPRATLHVARTWMEVDLAKSFWNIGRWNTIVAKRRGYFD